MLHLGLFLLGLQSGMPAAASQSQTLYPAGLVALSEDTQLASKAFVVDKSRRILRVYDRSGELPKLLAEYPADIGKRDGDKVRENDHRTPVGIYFLLKKLTQPEIPFDLYGSLAFTTDYPNVFDRRLAKTGYGIWLHAIPDSVALTRGSRGCVVVRNDVIQKVADFVELEQTPIVIADELTEISEAQYVAEKKRLLGLFEKWRQSWQDSDVDTYIQFYDSSFRGAGMNRELWYQHKKRLKGLYKSIEVQLGSPLILRNKDQVVIRTLQRYKSNLHEDFGEKIIHAFDDPQTGFKIVREDWKPISKESFRLSHGEAPQTREPASAKN